MVPNSSMIVPQGTVAGAFSAMTAIGVGPRPAHRRAGCRGWAEFHVCTRRRGVRGIDSVLPADPNDRFFSRQGNSVTSRRIAPTCGNGSAGGYCCVTMIVSLTATLPSC